MDRLQNVELSDLRRLLAEVDEKESTERLMAAIAYKNGVDLSDLAEWFDIDRESPYMLLVCQVREGKGVPAVTHVDGSARLQTVKREDHPAFYDLIADFDRRTGCPVLINTSFNVRGEPIVCTPTDAYRCFMRTEMDYLILENIFLDKNDQPSWKNETSWQEEFELD